LAWSGEFRVRSSLTAQLTLNGLCQRTGHASPRMLNVLDIFFHYRNARCLSRCTECIMVRVFVQIYLHFTERRQGLSRYCPRRQCCLVVVEDSLLRGVGIGSGTISYCWHVQQDSEHSARQTIMIILVQGYVVSMVLAPIITNSFRFYLSQIWRREITPLHLCHQ